MTRWRSLSRAARAAASRASTACFAASCFFFASSSLAVRRPVAEMAVRRSLRETEAAAR